MKLDPNRKLAPEQINDIRFRMETHSDTKEAVAEMYHASVENIEKVMKEGDNYGKDGTKKSEPKKEPSK